MARRSVGERMYGALLHVLPGDFRGEFGAGMEETFRLQRAEQSEHGLAAVLRMWWAAIVDIFRMAPQRFSSKTHRGWQAFGART